MADQAPPSNDNGIKKAPTFKQQLDRAATGESEKQQSHSVIDTVIDKVSEYVPAASKILDSFHTGKKESDTAATEPPAGDAKLPERPNHDVQIGEFVREQHTSKNSDDFVKASKGLE